MLISKVPQFPSSSKYVTKICNIILEKKCAEHFCNNKINIHFNSIYFLRKVYEVRKSTV